MFIKHILVQAWGGHLCRRGGFANFAAETSLPDPLIKIWPRLSPVERPPFQRRQRTLQAHAPHSVSGRSQPALPSKRNRKGETGTEGAEYVPEKGC